jgi:hypothetical protein
LSCQLDKSSDRRGLYTARATGSYESRSLVYLSAALSFFCQSFQNLPRSWGLVFFY